MRTLPRLVVVLLVILAPLGATVTAGAATATSARQSSTPRSGAPFGDALAVVSEAVEDASDGDAADSATPLVHAAVETSEDVPLFAIGAAAYSRYDDSDPLEHETRRRLYEAVVSTPGIHLAALAADTGVPVSTASYHSRVLDAEGLLDVRKPRGRKRLFPVAMEATPALDAALADDATAAVLTAVSRHEPATVTELADDLDRARSTVSYHLGRLAEDGLLDRERTGQAVETSLAPETRARLGRN